MSPGLAALATALVAIGTLGLGVFVYRQSVKRDKVVEKAGIATLQSTSIEQVMEGLTSIGDALRRDNAQLRTEVVELRASIDDIRERLEAVEVANTDLRTKENELERENVRLQSENVALKSKVETLTARVAELERLNGQ